MCVCLDRIQTFLKGGGKNFLGRPPEKGVIGLGEIVLRS